MKKIIVLMIGLFLITGCSLNSKTSKTYKDISYDEYNEKLENKDSFVVLLWQTGCSHCEEFEPVLNDVVNEYDLEVYGLNMANLEPDQAEKVKNKTFISGTPTLVYFKDGTNEEKMVGKKSKEQLVKFFENIGYIKEK